MRHIQLHNISGKVASKFYNDMETPVQIILGSIGSGKTFALQMKIIRLACEQIPVPTFHFTKCHKTFFIILETKLRNPY
jgi:tRNA A37 threonylcarbamoyladenosine biosynthesis protein TsaE